MTILLVAFLVGAAAHGVDDFARARGKVRAYEDAQQSLARIAWETGQAPADLARCEREARELEQRAQACLVEARELYRRGGIATASDSSSIRDYAAVLSALGDYDLAAEALERAVQGAAGDGALWLALGENLSKMGSARRPDAFQALRKALSVEPPASVAAKAWFALGDLYRTEGLFEFSRENFEAALEAAPEDIRTRIALAALKVRGGRIVDGSKDLDALGNAAQPFDAETRVLLREAIADFEGARRNFPDTAENHAAYARLLYRAGRIQGAILAANRAVRLNPDDAETWKFIGLVQMQLGNTEQAAKAYERSLQINPGQPDLQRLLEQLKKAEVE